MKSCLNIFNNYYKSSSVRITATIPFPGLNARQQMCSHLLAVRRSGLAHASSCHSARVSSWPGPPLALHRLPAAGVVAFKGHVPRVSWPSQRPLLRLASQRSSGGDDRLAAGLRAVRWHAFVLTCSDRRQWSEQPRHVLRELLVRRVKERTPRASWLREAGGPKELPGRRGTVSFKGKCDR